MTTSFCAKRMHAHSLIHIYKRHIQTDTCAVLEHIFRIPYFPIGLSPLPLYFQPVRTQYCHLSNESTNIFVIKYFFLLFCFFLCSRSGLKYYRREKCCEKSSERQTRLTKFKRLHRYQEAQSIVHLHNDFGTVPKIFPNDWNAFVARQIYSKGNVLSVVWLLMFFCTYRFPNGKIYFCYYIYETFWKSDRNSVFCIYKWRKISRVNSFCVVTILRCY